QAAESEVELAVQTCINTVFGTLPVETTIPGARVASLVAVIIERQSLMIADQDIGANTRRHTAIIQAQIVFQIDAGGRNPLRRAAAYGRVAGGIIATHPDIPAIEHV